jgi:CheY-like chemotaxis protein
MGSAELALQVTDPDSSVAGNLHDILSASERAADLCRQMLAYAGKSPFQTSEIDLTHSVKSIAGLIETSVEENVAVEFELEADIGSIGADRAQIEQATINLVSNAAEAIEGDGCVRIRTGSRFCPSGYFEARSYPYELPEGDFIFLEVSDDGRGMSAEIQNRIFEPFFTTKFMGRGLGLAAVFGIIRRHHGAITVESLPGRGSRFTLYFPQVKEQHELIELDRGARQLSLLEEEVRGKVLIVDDEEMVRNLAAMVLQREGISAVLAEDGMAGIQALKDFGDEIGCILLDMSMPRMDGAATLEGIHAVAPGVPVIIMSGHSEKQLACRFGEDQIFDFLPKPFAIEQLRSAIRRALSDLPPVGTQTIASQAPTSLEQRA